MDPQSIWAALGLTFVKVAAFIVLMLVVGQRVIPWILHYVVYTGSRELFRLAVLAIALGVAFGSAELFGVSFALGAFFAGMILAESTLSQQAARETLPLRDAFAVLFFVSVGMLFDPSIVVREPGTVVATFFIIVGGNALAAFLIVFALRHTLLTALTSAAALSQIGEFSFILAGLGIELQLLPENGRDLILAGAILSILANPLLFFALDKAKPWLSERERMTRPGCEVGQSVVLVLRPAILDHDILALDVTGFTKALPECRQIACTISKRRTAEETDHRRCRLLRPRRERPRRRAADKRDEIAPLQWIELHPFPPARPDCKISNWRGPVSRATGDCKPSSAARPRAGAAFSPIVRTNMLSSLGSGEPAEKGEMMRRRDFLALLGAGAVGWPRAALAQGAGRMSTIGVLWPAASPPAPPRMESFRQALRQLGFVEGKNVRIELRYARGGAQQLPELAAELVDLKVDVITTFGDFSPRVAQQATRNLPIVAIGDDILGAGNITSLSQPGGNTTGLTILAPELSAKRLEALQEMVPKISRVAVLWDPTTGASQVSTTENAARALKLKLQVLEIRQADDLAGAFAAARNGQAEALNVFSSPFLSSLHPEIISLAAKYRLPAIYQWREHVEAGGLLSYGPDLAAMWRQSATIVAKILDGAKPANLPVEQPTKFELALNAKTASSLGLPIPPSMLVRADQLIE